MASISTITPRAPDRSLPSGSGLSAAASLGLVKTRLSPVAGDSAAYHVCWQRHARQAHASGSARTYVLVDDQRITGYFSLSVGQIDSLQAAERVRKGMGSCPMPVVILARLAVSVADPGRSLGVGLLQDAIRRTLAVSDQAGVRALLTHPIDEAAARFYLRFGFETSPAREQQLILLLKDAQRLPQGGVSA